MIVKVQAPLGGNATSQYLIYDKDRSINTMWDIGTSAVLDELMDGYAKRYFHASINSEGILNIDTGTTPSREECDW